MTAYLPLVALIVACLAIGGVIGLLFARNTERRLHLLEVTVSNWPAPITTPPLTEADIRRIARAERDRVTRNDHR